MDVALAGQVVWSAMHGVVSLVITYPDFPWAEQDQLIVQVVENMIEGLKA